MNTNSTLNSNSCTTTEQKPFISYQRSVHLTSASFSNNDTWNIISSFAVKEVRLSVLEAHLLFQQFLSSQGTTVTKCTVHNKRCSLQTLISIFSETKSVWKNFSNYRDDELSWQHCRCKKNTQTILFGPKTAAQWQDTRPIVCQTFQIIGLFRRSTNSTGPQSECQYFIVLLTLSW